jgi:hypothetical protein
MTSRSLPHFAPLDLSGRHERSIMAPRCLNAVSYSGVSSILITGSPSAPSHRAPLAFSICEVDSIRRERALLGDVRSSAEVRTNLPTAPRRCFSPTKARGAMLTDRRSAMRFEHIPTKDEIRNMGRISRQIKEVEKKLHRRTLPEGGVYPIQSLLPVVDVSP